MELSDQALKQKPTRRQKKKAQDAVRITGQSDAKVLPAAVATVSRAEFRISQTENGLLVSGCDLVQPLPNTVAVYNNVACFACIPANPCYWSGTRLAALASVHQCYRPRRFKARYVPQVAVTEAGTVLVGTLWNTPAAAGAFDQSLVTSNGGAMSPCYCAFETSVTLGACLPQNLFNCAGPMHPDTNPFLFLAYMRGANVIPGYFFIEYEYELKNPLGYAISYGSSQTYAPDYGNPRANRSAVVLQTIESFAGPGLVIDVEADGSTLYNGTLISIPNGAAICNYWNQPVTNTNPSVGSITTNVVLTNARQNIGATVGGIPNKMALNWVDGTNRTTGIFRPGQAAGGGCALVEGEAKFWVDTNDSLSRVWAYAWDNITDRIQSEIGNYLIEAGTEALPSIAIPVLRKVISQSRSAPPDGILKEKERAVPL